MKTPKAKEPPLSELCSKSAHCVFLSNDRLTCHKCRASVSTHPKQNARLWISSACFPVEDQELAIGTSIHIGHLGTHPSHRIMIHNNVIYCARCGAYTNSRHLIKLAQVCRPPTKMGEEVIKAIKSDGLASFLHSKLPSKKICSQTSHRSHSAVEYVQKQWTDQQKEAQFFGTTLFSSQLSAGHITQESLPSITDGAKGIPPNIKELLELHEDGISVIWPDGIDYNTAKHLVQQELELEKKKTADTTVRAAKPRPDLKEFIVTAGDTELPQVAPTQKIKFIQNRPIPRLAKRFKPNLTRKRFSKFVSLSEHQEKKKRQFSVGATGLGHAEAETLPHSTPGMASSSVPGVTTEAEQSNDDSDASLDDLPEDPDVRVFTVVSDHEFFQVPQVPSVRELNKAYKRLALVMHPDKYGSSDRVADEWATKAFQRLQSRYERFKATLT